MHTFYSCSNSLILNYKNMGFVILGLLSHGEHAKLNNHKTCNIDNTAKIACLFWLLKVFKKYSQHIYSSSILTLWCFHILCPSLWSPANACTLLRRQHWQENMCWVHSAAKSPIATLYEHSETVTQYLVVAHEGEWNSCLSFLTPILKYLTNQLILRYAWCVWPNK